ncbi:MAG: hypothetical protein OEY51_00710, partial [Cyclobacteriaceae bacterium]|nr:hypothetical protein [Cyclobacteriaceae bacterium]
MKGFCFSFVFFIHTTFVYSQYAETCKWVSADDDWLVTDSLSIIPGSFSLSAPAGIKFDQDENKIFLEPLQKTDSVQICYSTYRIILHRRFSHRALKEDHKIQAMASKDVTREKGQNEGLPGEENEMLSKVGSISRGIDMGNTRDVTVRSNMDLTLEGKLTDDLAIKAVITDRFIPYQPEGNTERIRELDNLNITLYHDNYRLGVGDLTLQSDSSHFVHYSRTVMGGEGLLKSKAGDTRIGLSANRGKFHSTVVEVMEGVQGPYHIEGPEGEPYVIILANSETVFLDGQALSRGEENDYTIDYNLGEITFTHKTMITRYSRVRIEFEIANRNYERTSKSFSHQKEYGKVSFFTSFFQEKDIAGEALNDQFGQSERQLLFEGGDHPSGSFEGVIPVAFYENTVSYIMIDTVLANGENEKIYQYSRDSTKQHYHITFISTGVGGGDYIRDYTIINAVVYQFVAPLDGVRQGNFVPGTPIKPPQLKQMMSSGASVKLGEYEKIFAEFAVSKHDMNTLSPFDDHNNFGSGIITGVSSHGRKIPFLPTYVINGQADYEKNSQNFTVIDPIRNVEFNRDWGIPDASTIEGTEERIINGAVEVTNQKNSKVSYEGSLRKRGELINGRIHSLSTIQQTKYLNFTSRYFDMENDGGSYYTGWKKMFVDMNTPLKILVPGYSFRTERNKTTSIETGTILGSAQYFGEHRFYLKNIEGVSYKLLADYSMRKDHVPINGEFALEDESRTARLLYEKTWNKNKIMSQLSYRNLQTYDQGEISTFSARLSQESTLLKDYIKTRIHVETRSSLEAHRDFIYVEVPTGQGNYSWRDMNGDGLQQPDEFFQAILPDEQNYIRIFVATEERIPVYESIVRSEMLFKAPKSNEYNGFLTFFLSKITGLISFQSIGKVLEGDVRSRVFSLSENLIEGDILSGNRSTRAR